MARAGAAVVLFALICCLLVAPAPARRPVELPVQVVHDAVDREAATEPLLPKPSAVDADAAHPTVREEEVGRALARPHDGLVFRCGGDAAVLSSSEEPLSLGGWAQPARKGEVEDMQERPYDSDSSDSDWDSDSDEDGIVGWFWGLAHLF